MKGLSPIVKTIARWVCPFILAFGVYIVLTGHLTPGGGFPGGVILAGCFVLLTLAYGKEKAYRVFGLRGASTLDSLGAFAFLAIGLLGLVFGRAFLSNFIGAGYPGTLFRLFSGGNMPVINLAVGVKVCSSLFLVFGTLAAFRVFEE